MKHSIEKLEIAELCWSLCTTLSFLLFFLLRHGYERSVTLLACCFSSNILFSINQLQADSQAVRDCTLIPRLCETVRSFPDCARLYAHSQTVRDFTLIPRLCETVHSFPDCVRLYAHSQTVRDFTLIPRLCETVHSFPDCARLYAHSQTVRDCTLIPRRYETVHLFPNHTTS